jgi:uncharacterized protein YjbJ (UPF0337 family)
MATNTGSKAEKIKNNINGYAGKSKEAIREIIGQTMKQMETAIDTNSTMFRETNEKLNLHGVDKSTIGSIKDAFAKSTELAEDTFDAVINCYTRQMENTVDYNSKLVELVKEGQPGNADKFLDLIHENFEATKEMTLNNTKEILNFYNKHTNLALNFNKTFGDNINKQVDALFQIQSKGLDNFTRWASDWWKEPHTEKA